MRNASRIYPRPAGDGLRAGGVRRRRRGLGFAPVPAPPPPPAPPASPAPVILVPAATTSQQFAVMGERLYIDGPGK